MDDYIRHLFPYLDSSRIMTLSCGHVIPKENLIAIPISVGPNDVELEFTFEKRHQSNTIDALGSTITKLAEVIPDGLVVFFPSYGYLEQVISRWQTSRPGSGSTWSRLLAHKPVFRESKESTSVESTLEQYSAAINSNKGALLLSVVGGKMSEGINFSDRLGRGVIVVGLPFPNIQSAEWKAKMQYIESSTVARGGGSAEGKAAAREFYENACMRAVNQSIGRAIRHRGDYASIVLLDRRYGTKRIQEKLPGWIRSGLIGGGEGVRFGTAVPRIQGFFEQKRH